ncbi:hypothetical protein OEZ60_00010 [Defluviimonas sp. WL0024]|uniref:Uncharacterized protein n=1 Tax=Albidovulum salinarum TaxID=2984153 RepID=A0ABT2WXJ7_9RHOB|nr:hypothetical protein [Defluviimonas sp. WL0024]MCU9846387.1 hypothetical protein [Defluviimonas sp. WL0024]
MAVVMFLALFLMLSAPGFFIPYLASTWWQLALIAALIGAAVVTFYVLWILPRGDYGFLFGMPMLFIAFGALFGTVTRGIIIHGRRNGLLLEFFEEWRVTSRGLIAMALTEVVLPVVARGT